MWAKLDDKLPRHPKVLAAAKRVGGKFGRVRVLGTFADILCYCAEYLTGGFFPLEAVSQLSDPEPQPVLDACLAVGLLEPRIDGYQVHDYEDENPDADAEKARRKRDAERKRIKRAAERGGDQLALALITSGAMSADTSTDAARTRPPHVHRTADGHDADASRARVRAGAIVPSRPVPSRDRNPQEQRFAPRVLARLAHTVLDDVDAGRLDVLDVPEELKLRAARARLDYTAEALGKARESAEVQRRRRRA